MNANQGDEIGAPPGVADSCKSMDVGKNVLPQRKPESHSVAVFATAVPLRSLIAEFVASSESFAFLWSAATLVELLRNHSRHPANVLVLEVAAMESRRWNVLHELHSLAPATLAVFVGEADDIPQLQNAVRWGLRAVVPTAQATATLARALRAVVAGQVWFSRELASALIAPHRGEFTDSGKATSDDDTWRQLPALTDRELSVLHEVVQGRSNKEVARTLAISEQTVKIHMQNIFHKLRVHRRIDLMLLHAGTQPSRR